MVRGRDGVGGYYDDTWLPREEEGDGEEEGAGGDGSDDSEVDEPPEGWVGEIRCVASSYYPHFSKTTSSQGGMSLRRSMDKANILCVDIKL